jgi:DNA-binding response OmpR family regulator
LKQRRFVLCGRILVRRFSLVPRSSLKSALGAVEPLPSPKPVILCIEDNLLYLTLRKAVLEQEGYDVIGVTTASDALKALREAPICAIIADHMLRGTSGTNLAKKMKAVKPQVPIVLFSGTVPEKLQNIDVYLNKGEPTAEFLKIVRSVVDRYRS